MDSLIGQIVDNYRIDEIIGRGGMGVVFKATDLNLEKTVALKMIDPFLARDDNFLKRFKTEARALAKLENINIVSVFALRETNVGLFMVMEYVKAKTVSEWIKERGKLSISEAVTVTHQLLNAIGHAHSVGVIHRDIKPNNILLYENGTVKVMDFGLAKVVQDVTSQNTVTQTAAGTLYYMSPEQIKGLKNVDNRSDIYSIGISVYEMIVGRTPFDKSKSEFEIQKQIIDGDIPSPSQFNSAIPKALVKFIKKAIDKNPDKRFQSINEMKAALSEVDLPVSEIQEKTILINDSSRVVSPPVSKKRSIKKLYYFIPVIVIIAIAAVMLITSQQGKDIADNETDPLKQIVNTKTKNEDTGQLTVLYIKSNPPGAEVFINGNKKGVTPFTTDELSKNIYKIALKKPGYEQWIQNEYTLKEGKNDLEIDLKPAAIISEATLILNSIPAAQISINNKPLSGGGTSKVKPGKHTITFNHPQYGSKSTSIELSEGQSKSITCYFEQQVNIQTLDVAGEPIWGTVYLNGVNTNRTTPVDLPLGPGKYVISVKKAGYKTVEDDVSITVVPAFQKKTNSLVFHFK